MILTVNPDSNNGARKGTSVVGESYDTRHTRMIQFHIDRPIIYRVGRFLSTMIEGASLATRIARGETVDLEAISVQGHLLPLYEGYSISLANISVWGCPACGSAHGSGHFHSRRVSVRGLESNEFFYEPTTRSLFSISDTCWGEHVKATGRARQYTSVIPSNAPRYAPPVAVEVPSVPEGSIDATEAVSAPVEPITASDVLTIGTDTPGGIAAQKKGKR